MRHLYDVDHRDMKRGIILKLFATQMSLTDYPCPKSMVT